MHYLINPSDRKWKYKQEKSKSESSIFGRKMTKSGALTKGNFFRKSWKHVFYTNWRILSIFGPKIVFFQKCSECFNSCKKHVFTILKKIFLCKWPRLSHFSTRNWTFRFWLFLFIYSLLVTRVDLLVQNKTAKKGLNEFCTPVVQEKPNSQENWL